MKKINILILITLLIGSVACKKNANKAVTVGDTNKCIITDFSTVVQGEYVGSQEHDLNEKTVYFNIDNNESKELIVTVVKDSNYFAISEEGKYIYYSYIEANFLGCAIGVKPNSNLLYESYNDYTYDYSGAKPEKQWGYTTGCEFTSVDEEIEGDYAALSLSVGDIVGENLDWRSKSEKILISNSGYVEKYSQDQGDTIVSEVNIIEAHCDRLSMGERHYIPLRLEKKDDFYYGWLELEVLPDHSINVIRSVIKK